MDTFELEQYCEELKQSNRELLQQLRALVEAFHEQVDTSTPDLNRIIEESEVIIKKVEDLFS